MYRLVKGPGSPAEGTYGARIPLVLDQIRITDAAIVIYNLRVLTTMVGIVLGCLVRNCCMRQEHGDLCLYLLPTSGSCFIAFSYLQLKPVSERSKVVLCLNELSPCQNQGRVSR
ncbi:hypothetical protein F4779DRAFT_605320 [Xylariaceae sp. FL0662B]|nr:hypothetical protein F4779DRAFT_605320 [Xylariaceae sp. FL0662B]